MTFSSGSPEKAKRGSDKPSSQQEGIENDRGWLDRFADLWFHFDRFGWDILGIILLTITLLTFLGLVGFTKGAFISPWVGFLTLWTGWGSYLIIIFFGILGLVALRKRFAIPGKFKLGRVISLEMWIFCALALFSMVNGRSLMRAEQGLDGGLIGWGLSEWINYILPGALGNIFIVTMFIIFTMAGFGLWRWIAERFDKWLQTEYPESDEEVKSPIAGGHMENLANFKLPDSSDDNLGEKRPSHELVRSLALPPLDILDEDLAAKMDEEDIHNTAVLIEKTLAEFGIPANVVGYRVGPTVTQFAIEPGYTEKNGTDGEPTRQKVRVAQISGLSKDLALALSAERIRIEAPVPGHSFVGIEVPNSKSSIVRLKSILESEEFNKHKSSLMIAMGRDVSGQPVVADLARMPHLLIAGTTGSGKSVCIAALTACLAMNNSPQQLKMVMLDPKMVELVRFNGLPHLLGKVETETTRILAVLAWAMTEMDRRYRLLEEIHARDIDVYNQRMARKKKDALPRIVILIDELADLMMTAPDQTETSLIRLAQMARATGIHLVVATQRPSTDVVTGLIKANFPARISFSVASSIDSRVILDSTGAETLLGRGDMLFLNPENGSPLRSQGVMVSDQEIEKIINFWKESTAREPSGNSPWEDLIASQEVNGADHLIEEAIKIVRKSQRASTSMLQRRLRIGYPRAARLIDELEELGVVGPSQGGGRDRDVLISNEDDETDPDLDDEDDTD
jgi:DNA segregation ATPase FtsK/SpoIIIE, S-DNA-T family